MTRRVALMLVSLMAAVAAVAAVAAPQVDAAGKIAWYSTLKQGLAVAKASGRPILLISAAPHCRGISGMW
jgi:hypothetical protein